MKKKQVIIIGGASAGKQTPAMMAALADKFKGEAIEIIECSAEEAKAIEHAMGIKPEIVRDRVLPLEIRDMPTLLEYKKEKNHGHRRPYKYHR